ncbi:MAG: hypothetical protein IT232_08580 [Flavobacteriales bacterium]|nr:hypothetical protein [Flavobacteriales bacterium]
MKTKENQLKENKKDKTTTTTTKMNQASFSELDESKADQEKLKAEYEEKKEEKTERRGRKKKEVIQQEEENKIFGQSVSNLGTYSFGLLIARIYPDQPLSPEESKSLNEAVEAVAVKYVSIVGKYKEETGLALCLAFIFLPRYLAQQDKKKKEKEKEKETLIE